MTDYLTTIEIEYDNNKKFDGESSTIIIIYVITKIKCFLWKFFNFFY